MSKTTCYPITSRCCIPNNSNISSVYQEPDCNDANGIGQNGSLPCCGKYLEERCHSQEADLKCCISKSVSFLDHINCTISDKVKQSINLIWYNEGHCQTSAQDGSKARLNKIP